MKLYVTIISYVIFLSVQPYQLDVKLPMKMDTCTFKESQSHFAKVAHMEQKVSKKVLKNGLTVLVSPVYTVPKVSTQLWYHVGSKDEQSGQKGLAHLIEHMIFKGTKKLSESDINLITEKLSGYTNAFTSHDATGYVFDFPTQNWKEALHMYADCMQNARFDTQMLNSEMKAVIQELKMYKDDYFSDLFEKMLQAIFPDHPYHYPIIGFKQDLWSVDRDTLFAFYKKHYVPNNAALVVVGDVDVEDVFKTAEEIFGNIPKDETYSRPEFYHGKDLAATSVTIARDVKQSMMLFAFTLPGEKAKQRYVFECLVNVLGRGKTSRLYKKLVDQTHLLTDFAIMLDRLEDATLAVMYCEPKNIQDEEKIKEIIHKEIADIITNGLSKKELNRAIKALKVKQINGLESNYKQASAIGDSFIKTGDENFSFNYINRSTDNLEKEIQEVLEQYFSPALMHAGKVVSMEDSGKKLWAEMQRLSDQEDARILDGRARDLPIEPPVHAHTIANNRPKEFVYHKPEEAVLKNGAKLFVHNNSVLPKIDVVISFKARAHYDPPAKQGLYNFMCSMMLEGTKNYPGGSLAEAFEELGMSLELEPGFLGLSMLNEDFEKGLELLNELLTRATFDEKELEKIRQHLLADLSSYWDSPSDFSGHLIREKIYENHPYAQNKYGTLESIKSITRQDLIDFYHAHIVPFGARISVVGSFADCDIKARFEEGLQGWKGNLLEGCSCPVVQETKPGRVVYPINRDQVVVAFAKKSIKRKDADFDKLLLFDQIFSGGASGSMNSRLFALREQTGLFYTISGSLVAGADEEPGMFLVKTIVSLDRLEEAKAAIKKTMTEVVESVTEEELDRAKDTIVNSIVNNFASNKRMASTFIAIDRFDLGKDYFDKRPEVIRSISLHDVKEAAKKIINTEQMITFEVGRLEKEAA
jgi:zinc protease